MSDKTILRKIEQLLAGRKKRNRRNAFVGFFACLVALCTIAALTLPAVTGENTGYRFENGSLSHVPGLRNGTYYSSDLADFVTGIVIRDADGNVIPPNGTVYIGERYDVSISFSEDNISGQEKQFQYDADGYLTYQIPDFFVCSPVPNGTLTDSSGVLVGTFTIDASGLLRVRFNEGYIDSSKASFNITFNSTASNSGGSGLQPIDFGGYTVYVNVSTAGVLLAEKTAGNYDPRTHSIDYEVAVSVKRGPVTNIVYTDLPTSPGLTIDPSSVTYTSLDGLTVYSSQPTSLNAGEGFLVRYRAVLDPSIYTGKNAVSYKAKNYVSVTGMNEDGPVTAEATAQIDINTRFLQKSGKDEPANSRIRWTVTVGDGSTPVDGLTVTDLPGSGLSFDTAEEIQIVPWTYAPDGTLVEGTPFRIPFGSDPTQIVIPSGLGAYRCDLTYYTTYAMTPGLMTENFENTVSASDPLHGPVTVTKTVTAHAPGAPPDIVKQMEKNSDGTALHVTVETNVPGAYGGLPGFYLVDTFEKLTYGDVEYFFGQDVDNLSVSVTNLSGVTVPYTLYTDGSTDRTFLFRPASDPRTFYVYFNVASFSTSSSNWIETEDTTLRIEYDIPFSGPVYLRPDGVNYVPADGVTFGDVVQFERVLSNRARLYYNHAAFYTQDTATFQEISDDMIRKRGTIRPDDTIEYEVIFNNRDPAFETILKRKMKALIFHDTLQTDGMHYVDGSLYCDIYNASLSHIRTTYHYSGSIGGLSALDASAEDFVWYSGSNPAYTTLWEYAQHSTIGGDSTSTSRLVFRYRVAIDRTSPTFETTALTVPLHNRARLTGTFPDDRPFDTGPADATVNCSTDIVKKDVAHTDGSNRAEFTITINPAGVDLLDTVSRMTILDRMSSTLRPVLPTIRVYLKNGGVWEETVPQYTYDADQNTLAFTLPDDVPIRIVYTTLITQTGDNVSIGNNIVIEGFAEYSAVVDTAFNVDDTGGAAQTDNFRFTLLKQSSDRHLPLSGAVFALYGPPHSEREGIPPSGVPAECVANDVTLRYYTSYTTGSNGISVIENNEFGLALFSVQGMYALKEITAPNGYHLLADPIVFYADERPTGGSPDIPVVLSESPVVASNEPFTYALPETGGGGTEFFTLAGVLCLLLAGALRSLRKKDADDHALFP